MSSPAVPTNLTAARLQLHYAIQLIAAAGAAIAPARDDYSHTALSWNPTGQYFTGALLRGTQPVQVAIDPIPLTALIVTEQGQTLAQRSLHQTTLADSVAWLQQELTNLGCNGAAVTPLTYPPDDFPDHAIAHGGAFDASHPGDRAQLIHYYDLSHTLLHEVMASATQRGDQPSPLWIWPHHFDLASLITLPSSGTKPLTIGVGLSPGDSNYDEPYWYVSPYPYPDVLDLPGMPGCAFWHTEGWVGVVLVASHRELSDQPEHLGDRVRAFFSNAVQVCHSLLLDLS